MIIRYLRLLSLLLCLSLASTLPGQDLHYSLLDFMPTWVNPGLTGAYEGTARVGGVFRDQNTAGAVSKNYQTPGFYVDAPIVMLGKKAWLGVGGTLIQDAAGLANMKSIYAQGSASYHRILNQQKQSKTTLSVGLMGGILKRNADLSSNDIILAEEEDVSIGGGGLGKGGGADRMPQNPNATGVDIGFGVSLARQLDADRNFRVGVSGRHVVSPDYALTNSGDQRPLSLSLQGAYRQLLGQDYLLEPQVFVQTTGGGFLAAQLQAMGGMYLGTEKSSILRAGLGIRLPARFVYPMVGYEVGNLKLAAAFDISANQLQTNAEGFQRGFEIGVQYIIKVYKQPKVDRVILCPQI